MANTWAGWNWPLVGIASAPEQSTDILDNQLIDGIPVRQILGAISAVLLGKVSGQDANLPVFRSVDDTRDAVSATTDVSGNRSSVTIDWE